MKILLDENLDHALRKLLPTFDVMTVSYMGWAGLKNGELLQAAEDAGFEVFVTGDQHLRYEQNLSTKRVAVIVLSAIQLPMIRSNVRKIVSAIECASSGSVQWVDCGTFKRKRSLG